MQNRTWGMYFLLFFMLLAAAIFGVYSVRQVLLPSGATDFHSYWYAGQFVRQGDDPYQAFFDSRMPAVPISYLDGETTEQQPVAQTGLAITPANTAPIVLLLSLFSYWSWPTAKLLWMIFNFVLLLLIPWLVIKLLPDGDNLPVVGKLFIWLAFFVLQGTRISIWTGQTTLFVFTLMLLALLTADKKWWLSGLFLGIALAKYSLALPLFLFLLYKRRYAVVVVGLLVQGGALLLLSLLGGSPPWVIMGNYGRLLLHHTGFPGIHLASLFPQSTGLAFTAVSLMTIIVGGITFQQYRRQVAEKKPLLDFYLFTILMLWTLLVAYHRVYDTAVFILFITLTVYELTDNTLSQRQKTSWALLFSLFLLILSFPASVIGLVLPADLMPTWYQLASAAMTLALLGALLLALWRFRLFARL